MKKKGRSETEEGIYCERRVRERLRRGGPPLPGGGEERGEKEGHVGVAVWRDVHSLRQGVDAGRAAPEHAREHEPAEAVAV